MASSTRVVTTNPDLPRQSSVCSLSSLLAEPSKNITMDDLLLNPSIYSSSSSSEPEPNPNPEPATATAGSSVPKEKTMEEVWKEMVTGTTLPQPQPHLLDNNNDDNNNNNNEITLEDFLSNSKPAPTGLPLTDHHDDVTTVIPFAPPPFIPNGTALPVVAVSPSQPQPRAGRGKRRRGVGAVAVEEAVVDKATLQKQRRMIKNRESAARSRERKQAYTVELESMVVHLEEENARLLREEADRNKQRYKLLMECLIPVVEKRKPGRKLRRVNSVQW